MDLQASISGLSKAPDTGGPVATVTLDVSGSGILSKEAALFLREHVLARLEKGPRDGHADRLRRAATRIRDYVATTLKPETEGLYLAASTTALEAIELRVPLRNTVHVGSSPRIAPLVEAAQRWPKSLYVRYDDREADVQEFELGTLVDVASLKSGRPDGDVERSAVSYAAARFGSRGAGSGRGGDRRDRFQQTMNDEVQLMLRQAARAILARRPARETPILVDGKPNRSEMLLRHFPKMARAHVHHLAGTSRRSAPVRSRIMAVLDKAYRESVELQVMELLTRRSEGRNCMLGPEGVLRAMADGRLSRLFVPADDPAPGVRCSTCAGMFAGAPARCAHCGGDVQEVSLTEEALRQSIGHRSFVVTFVPGPAGWLTELGGMAALLAC